jgi:hypothetical protein
VTRAFVRNPMILDGRWTVDGTSIAVAQIRADLERMSRADVMRCYRFMELTEAEIDRVAAFPFEPIRDLTLTSTFTSVTVNCLCGEDTPVVIMETKHVAHCICGRDWNLTATVLIVPATDRDETRA